MCEKELPTVDPAPKTAVATSVPDQSVGQPQSTYPYDLRPRLSIAPSLEVVGGTGAPFVGPR